MSNVNEIRVGDVGTRIEITVLDGADTLDLSTASIIEIVFLLPDRTTKEVDASFVTDGTDGKVCYTTQEGDLSISGTWNLQAYVVIPGAGEWRSNIVSFRVFPNIAITA